MEWIEKYRPSCIDDLTIDQQFKDLFKSYIKKGTIPSVLFSGSPGIGKTTLAKVLVRELGCDSLYVNASDENSVDVMRTKIKEFTECAFGGLKVVILDESDYLTSAAQATSRNVIESCCDDTRFVLTCNYPNKIIDAIKSRCSPINLTSKAADILNRLIFIMDSEGIKYTQEDKIIITKNILKNHLPDIRSMIKHLEFCCVSGEFKYNEFVNETEIDEIVHYIQKNIKNHRECRKYWIANEIKFNKNYEILAGKIFDKFTDNCDKMDLIADYLFRMTNVLDKEIQFSSMISKLGKL